MLLGSSARCGWVRIGRMWSTDGRHFDRGGASLSSHTPQMAQCVAAATRRVRDPRRRPRQARTRRRGARAAGSGRGRPRLRCGECAWLAAKQQKREAFMRYQGVPGVRGEGGSALVLRAGEPGSVSFHVTCSRTSCGHDAEKKRRGEKSCPCAGGRAGHKRPRSVPPCC